MGIDTKHNSEQIAHEKEMRAMPSMPMDDDNAVPIPPGQGSVLIPHRTMSRPRAGR